MTKARSFVFLFVLCLSSATLAGVEFRSSPKKARVAREPPKQTRPRIDGPGRGIMRVFDNEAYSTFYEGSFRVHEAPPSAAAPYLAIEMESPNHDGFGGACIARTGAPIDLSHYDELVIDLETPEPAHQLEIKLERADSSERDAQFYAHRGALPRAGRQTLSLSLAGGAKVLPATQRLCFALTAAGFRNAEFATSLNVYRVSFR